MMIEKIVQLLIKFRKYSSDEDYFTVTIPQ